MLSGSLHFYCSSAKVAHKRTTGGTDRFGPTVPEQARVVMRVNVDLPSKCQVLLEFLLTIEITVELHAAFTTYTYTLF